MVGRRAFVVAMVAGACAAALIAGAALGGAIGAVKLLTPRGKPLAAPWQSWADSALVPTVVGRVTVRRARCPARPSAAGCVYTRRPRSIWMRPGIDDPRGVLLHELGHVFDLTVMNDRDRGGFRRIMGRRTARWWRGRLPLAEQFAEAYSWCARYARIVSIARYSSYRYRPSAREHRAVCRLIQRAAADHTPARKPADVPVVTGPHPPPTPSSTPSPLPTPPPLP